MKTRLTLLSAIFLIIVPAAVPAPAVPKGKYIFYVGTYTEGGTGSKGIYAYGYNAATQEVTPLGLAAETTNPSWIAVHPNGRFLYAVNEVQNYKGPNSGGVSAFSIDRDKTGRAKGKLTFLNEVRSHGADPCYVTVDKTGKWVLVANYTGGSVAVFPVLEDGKLGEASHIVQHTGHGTNPQRQESPHAHSIDLSPDNRWAFLDDLGLDALFSYRFDAVTGELTGNPVVAHFDNGGGPRHFALHPSGKFAYVVTELNSSVTALSADLQNGSFRALHWYATVPPDFKGENTAAEVETDPNGKFLFVSNRGLDAIVVFGIDPGNGLLSPLGMISTQGKTPRSFEMDPAGNLLLAENQKSDNIVLFRLDEKTGKLTPTGKVIDVPSPVCVKFLAVE